MSKQGSGEADYLALGDWNAICWRCGSKFKASGMMRNWQGFWTCRRCWEPRQPQDFVRNTKDVMTPPWTQPEVEPCYVLFCTIQGTSALPGYAIPGCATPGKSLLPTYRYPLSY